MKTLPPIDILDSMIVPDRDRGMPLYVQVRSAMRRVIDEHFDDGQQFWTEQALINRLSVSQITVRRALNDLAKDGVLMRRAAKGTIVRKVKHELSTNYRVAIFVPKYNSEILTSTIEHFAHVCHERGQRLHVHYTHKGQRVSDSLLGLEHAPSEQRVVLLGQPDEITSELLRLLSEQGYRTVTAETTIPTDQTDYVGYDDELGIQLALNYLTKLGHRRITLLVNEPYNADSIVIRRRAFEAASADLGIFGAVHSCGTQFWESAYDAAYDAMPLIWNQVHRPTAILTVSDAGAWAALRWLAEKAIRVPDEVSIMGFDDDRLSKFTYPALTTLERDGEQLAAAALRVLDQPETSKGKILIPPTVIVRESTGIVQKT